MQIFEYSESGSIPVFHLKRYWSKHLAIRNGQKQLWENEPNLDKALLSCLGLGLEPTMQYLYQIVPTFEDFENWIKLQSDLSLRQQNIAQFNALFEQKREIVNQLDTLSPEDLQFFDENGYLIVRQAISPSDCQETVELITNYLQIDLQQPATWYTHHTARQGIMVQLFNHPILERNRRSETIRKAYESLWQNSNLWVTTDRVGFNPPETEHWKYQCPNLHLDIEPQIPLPFGLQGILYLTDTAENQGAFTLVPGFHQKIDH